MILVVRVTIGAVFVLSTAGKLVHPVRFARGLSAYVRAPHGVLVILAVLLIALESSLAFTHIMGDGLAVAAPAAWLTLTIFAALVQFRLSSGKGGPCLCFSSDESEPISRRTLARLGLLIVAESYVLVLIAAGAWPDVTARPYAAGLSQCLVLTASVLMAMAVASWLLRARDVYDVIKPLVSGMPVQE